MKNVGGFSSFLAKKLPFLPSVRPMRKRRAGKHPGETSALSAAFSAYLRNSHIVLSKQPE